MFKISSTTPILAHDHIKMAVFRSIDVSSAPSVPAIRFFLFLLLLNLTTITADHTINVGAILNLNTFAGQQAKAALAEAVHDVNENITFMNSGTRLVLNIQDSAASAGNVLEVFGNETVSILIQDSQVSQFVVPIAEALQVPLISISGHDGYAGMGGDSRYLVSEAPDNPMSAIAALVGNFEWKEVIVICEDGVFWMRGVSTLNDELQALQTGRQIVHIATVPSVPDEKFVNDMLRQINTTYVRAFILHTSMDLALRIFSVADELDLLEEGYAWVVTDPIASYLDSLNASSIKTMQGIIGVRRYLQGSDTAGSSDDYKQLENIDGFYAYNTLWMIARAVNAVLNDSGETDLVFEVTNTTSDLVGSFKVFKQGQSLLEQILHMQSGGIADFLNLKNEEIPTYEIVNIAGRSYRTIGYWTKYEGFVISPDRKLTEKQNKRDPKKLLDVIWPGGSADVPSGYRTLVIGVSDNVVFSELVSVSNNNQISGFCIDMFEAAVKRLPYKLPFVYKSYSRGISTTSIYDELISLVNDTKRFDAVVGDVTILAERSGLVDFTQPYTDTGLMMMVPLKSRLNGGTQSFLHPFTPTLWGIAGTYFVVTAFLVWLVEHNQNKDFRGKPTKQVVTSLSFSFNSLVFASREKVSSSLGRGIIAAWLFTAFILNSSYTAKLTSILTIEKLSPTITNMENLNTSSVRVGYMTGSFVRDYLINSLNISQNRLVPLVSGADYVQMLANGTVGAIVDESPYIQLVTSLYCGNFAVVDQAFDTGGFGFLFRKGTPFGRDISWAVLNITEENDVVQSLRKKWFGDIPSSSQYQCVDALTNNTNSLSPKDVWSLFVVTASAYSMAVFIFIGRKVYKSTWETHNRVDAQLPNGGSADPAIDDVHEIGDSDADVSQNSGESRDSDADLSRNSGESGDSDGNDSDTNDPPRIQMTDVSTN